MNIIMGLCAASGWLMLTDQFAAVPIVWALSSWTAYCVIGRGGNT